MQEKMKNVVFLCVQEKEMELVNISLWNIHCIY